MTRSYKVSTGVGAVGFHPKVPLDLGSETCWAIVGFLAKVKRCGYWLVQASTLLFFSLNPKNVTSETPTALLPTLIRRREWPRAPAIQEWKKEEVE